MSEERWVVEKKVGERWQIVTTWGSEAEAIASYERECEFSDNWEDGSVRIRYEQFAAVSTGEETWP